ncbi:MAG TPA: hypothetical protein VL382_07150 [Terriglobales bacterium]|nr:hypothetical protein [Terriglobales bacterium]
MLLPRVSLLLAYFAGDLTPYGLHGWIPPALAVVVPRALVLILIFQDRGFSPWLLVHAVAMVFVYLSAGRKQRRKSR